MTPVKIALGIHKRETRDKSYAWREVGFIPTERNDPARGKKIFEAKGHLDTLNLDRLDGERDSSSGNEDTEQEPSEDKEEGEPAVKGLSSRCTCRLEILE